jgi:hypothetical protein
VFSESTGKFESLDDAGFSLLVVTSLSGTDEVSTTGGVLFAVGFVATTGGVAGGADRLQPTATVTQAAISQGQNCKRRICAKDMDSTLRRSKWTAQIV